jgi:hypothetical protein
MTECACPSATIVYSPPDDILRQVYIENAARLLRLSS